MISLRCSFRVPLGRVRGENFNREFVVDVTSPEEEGVVDVKVGRIEGDVLAWADAIGTRSLEDICEEDSQGWYEVWDAIADKESEGEFKPELELDMPIEQVLFIHRLLLHPCVHPWRQHILEAVTQQWSCNAIVVMWAHNPPFSPADYAEMGFARIAGTELIFRDLNYRSSLNEKFPVGFDEDETFEVIPKLSYGEWLEAAWECDLTGTDPDRQPPFPPE